MSSDLLHVGKSCALCSNVDFLPITCPSCLGTFCKDHIQAEAHSCSAPSRSEIASTTPFTKLERCALDGCNNPSLNAYSSLSSTPTCTLCQASFCAEHREPALHKCSSKQTLTVKNESARALLAKNFASTSKTSVKRQSGKLPSDPKKLAQYRKLELMKLRQRAQPLDSKQKKSVISVDDRRFFKARLPEKLTREFWVEKNVLTGKVFDLLSSQFGISRGESNKYQLCKLVDGEEAAHPLAYDRPFADQVEDGEEMAMVSIDD